MEALTAYFENVDLLQLAIYWGQRIVIALLIFVIGRWIARWLTKSFRRVVELEETLENFLANIIYAVLLTAVIIAALQSIGLPVTSLVAVLGAAGLAVGLALKDSLGNFAAGVMLVMFRPFTKGDFVEVAGTSGKVDEVRIFSTILTTPDNKQVTIPNGQVAGDTITNYSALDQRRVDMVFGVGYDDDLKVARGVLERICREHPKVLDDPATAIFVANLGESSVDFNVRPWCRTEDYWTVYGDLLETGKVELEAAGCSIPYPQRDVHTYHYQQGD
ncbi:MAG: mechanosensitive ion channel [Xanthomonadales bacterium]|nr:mechanosensitive ion channel [Xanthomonadales bacterium]NIX12674.1 mechanosensitive ion channel [Xanthomonadales bacterium]